MSYMNYIAQFGKGSMKIAERTFAYTATEGPTLGVAANANPTAYAATEGLLCIDNQATVNSRNGQIILPVCVHLWVTARGTAGTYAAVRWVLDNATQFSIGGTTLGAASIYYDTRSGYADLTAKGKVHFGDLTLVTGSSRKVVWETVIDSSATVFAIGDRHTFMFQDPVSFANVERSVATDPVRPGHYVHYVPGVQIGRQCSLIMQPLVTAMSAAPSFGVAVVTVELGHPREAA